MSTLLYTKKQATKRLSVKKVADLEQLEVPFLSEVYISEADFWSVIVEVDSHIMKHNSMTGKLGSKNNC